ncbi:UDP-glucuronosyl/UDP-glucosyltransferase [Trema orientale]|uniref:Glycosyltransferase n=1 Tax=Trema orientale TaxID=63057 RepID=A0A2P5EUM8_TREOI|nr:UDP-glucuronosyl/UDP-glucosyltransferase [Trema orientale]
MCETERENRNIVLFPFMAQGHIIPFLALAHRLEQVTNKYYTITLVTTQLNIPKLRLSLPPNSSIELAGIPFPGDGYGLPPGVENTDALPYHLISNFFEASLSLEPSFRKLISDLCSHQNGRRRPFCIVADIFFGWSVDIAREFGVFHAIFSGGGGFGIACYYSVMQNLPHRRNGAVGGDEFSLPDFPEASRIHVTQVSEYLRVSDGSDKHSIIVRKLLSFWFSTDAMLFNTVEELEQSTGLLYFRRIFGRDVVWAIGPVVSQVRRPVKEAGVTSEACTKWLDSKPEKSVLYVSFGSQHTIPAPQMMDLAVVLEASGKNFIWVVRPPVGFDINGEFKAEEWLPEGFEERITESKRGLVVRKWAPQVDILAHGAVSAFLSHCGWNSVLESISNGVPIIGWPFVADQFYNAKFLEEVLGVGVEVARGKSSRVGHEEMVEKIELVMNINGTEKGREIRRRAWEVRDIIKNAVKDEDDFKGSSVKAMDEFLNTAFAYQGDKR